MIHDTLEVVLVRHIVMWTLKEAADGRSKAQNAVRMRDAREGMRWRIAEILRLEVGLNVVQGPDAFDVALVADFAPRDAPERHQMHPAHKQVQAIVRTVLEAKYSDAQMRSYSIVVASRRSSLLDR